MQQQDVTCSESNNSQYLPYAIGNDYATGPDQWGQYTIKKDKQYYNEDGWIWIRLADDTYPHHVTQDPNMSLYIPHQQSNTNTWLWVSDEGRTFYMHWKPEEEAYSNMS